jgi:hypothetical protein
MGPSVNDWVTYRTILPGNSHKNNAFPGKINRDVRQVSINYRRIVFGNGLINDCLRL